EEKCRLSALTELIAKARAGSVARAAEAEKLEEELEALRRAGEEQHSRVAQARLRLQTEHEEQIRSEMEALRHAAEEQRRRIEEMDSARAAEVAEQEKAATEARIRDEEERAQLVEVGQQQADEQEQRQTKLSALKYELEEKARAASEQESQL